MKAHLLMAALLLPASALAAPHCDKLPKRVEKEQSAIRPVQRMIDRPAVTVNCKEASH